MTVIQCVCGHDKAERAGYVHCPHCDEGCAVQPHACRWCRSYNAQTNARVNDEYEAERHA